MSFWKKIAAPFAAIANPALALGGVSLATDLIGANQDRQAAKGAHNEEMALTREQMAMQKEFAQQGIRWRVDDAVAAGLHPLAALGSMPANAAAVPGPSTSVPGTGASWRALGNLSQNVSRAVMAGATVNERMIQDANLKKIAAETGYFNAMAAEAMSRVGQPQNPPMPMYTNYTDENGYVERGYSPYFSQALSSRPIYGLARDISTQLGNFGAAVKSLFTNLYLHKTQGKNYYYPGKRSR